MIKVNSIIEEKLSALITKPSLQTKLKEIYIL